MIEPKMLNGNVTARLNTMSPIMMRACEMSSGVMVCPNMRSTLK